MNALTYERLMLDDGSFTLLQPNLDEHYHNCIGAYTEAYQLYASELLASLKQRSAPPTSLTLWDVCFGLGYNSFAALNALVHEHAALTDLDTVSIHAVEMDASLVPIWQDVLALSHFETLRQYYDAPSITPSQDMALDCDTLTYTWLPKAADYPTLTLTIYIADAVDVLPAWQQSQQSSVDAVFHDAFSPKHVPHLWEASLFQIYADVLHDEGVVLTYSMARLVKDAMNEAGLQWTKTPRLGKKNGGMRAVKSKE
jgi:tRNA U34 5-methylaminomethyl-2-thiouridine-forming methyltransferase MnmC